MNTFFKETLLKTATKFCCGSISSFHFLASAVKVVSFIYVFYENKKVKSKLFRFIIRNGKLFLSSLLKYIESETNTIAI